MVSQQKSFLDTRRNPTRVAGWSDESAVTHVIAVALLESRVIDYSAGIQVSQFISAGNAHCNLPMWTRLSLAFWDKVRLIVVSLVSLVDFKVLPRPVD